VQGAEIRGLMRARAVNSPPPEPPLLEQRRFDALVRLARARPRRHRSSLSEMIPAGVSAEHNPSIPASQPGSMV